MGDILGNIIRGIGGTITRPLSALGEGLSYLYSSPGEQQAYTPRVLSNQEYKTFQDNPLLFGAQRLADVGALAAIPLTGGASTIPEMALAGAIGGGLGGFGSADTSRGLGNALGEAGTGALLGGALGGGLGYLGEKFGGTLGKAKGAVGKGTKNALSKEVGTMGNIPEITPSNELGLGNKMELSAIDPGVMKYAKGFSTPSQQEQTMGVINQMFKSGENISPEYIKKWGTGIADPRNFYREIDNAVDSVGTEVGRLVKSATNAGIKVNSSANSDLFSGFMSQAPRAQQQLYAKVYEDSFSHLLPSGPGGKTALGVLRNFDVTPTDLWEIKSALGKTLDAAKAFSSKTQLTTEQMAQKDLYHMIGTILESPSAVGDNLAWANMKYNALKNIQPFAAKMIDKSTVIPSGLSFSNFGVGRVIGSGAQHLVQPLGRALGGNILSPEIQGTLGAGIGAIGRAAGPQSAAMGAFVAPNIMKDNLQQQEMPVATSGKYGSLAGSIGNVVQQSRAKNTSMMLSLMQSGISAAQAKQIADSVAPIQKPVPAAVLKQISDAENSVNGMNALIGTIQNNGGQFGLVSGTAGQLGQILGMNQAGASIDTLLGNVAQNYAKGMEGGKVSDQDIKRYAKQLPGRQDSVENALAKLIAARDQAQANLQNMVSNYQQGGYDVSQ